MKRRKQFIAMLLSAAMMVTGIQVPVFAENDTVVTEVEETDPQETETPETETPQVVEESEEPTGAATRFHIHNEDDLASALNGKLADGTPITLPSVLMEDITLTKSITVDTDLELDMNGCDLTPAQEYGVSANKLMTLTIPAGKSLLFKNNAGSGSMYLNIINEGDFSTTEYNYYYYIKPKYGVPFYNKAGATASIKLGFDPDFRNKAEDGQAYAIINEGDLNLYCVRAQYAPVKNAKDASMNVMVYSNTQKNSYENYGKMVIKGRASKIINDGGEVEIGESATGSLTNGDIDYLYTYNNGTVQMNAGNVDDIYLAEQITLSAGSAAPEGKFTMAGGRAYRIHYIHNMPELLGGQVGPNGSRASSTATNAAIRHYEEVSGNYVVSYNSASYQTLEHDTSVVRRAVQHEKINGEIVEKPATWIVDGKVSDYSYDTATVSPLGVCVSSNAALLSEIADAPVDGTLKQISLVKGENGYDNTPISSNVVIKKGQNVKIYNRLMIDIAFAKDGTILIEEGATLELKGDNQYGLEDSLNDADNQKVLIINQGTFQMDDSYIWSNAQTALCNKGNSPECSLNRSGIGDCYAAVSGNASGITIDQQAGKLKCTASTITVANKNVTGLYNHAQAELVKTGIENECYYVSCNGIHGVAGSETVLEGTSSVFAGPNAADTLPVWLEGDAKLTMNGSGTIGSSYDYYSKQPYAIVYGTSLPVLKSGSVYCYSQTSANAVDGFAIATADGRSGSFVNAAGETVDTKKANAIVNGVPEYQSGILMKHPYLMMSANEIYDLSSNFNDLYKRYDAGDFRMTTLAMTPGTEVVALSENGIIVAKNPGYAVVKVFLSCSEDADHTAMSMVSDIVRIEVAGKDASEIKKEDFTGTILEPDQHINVFRQKNYFDFGYNLTSSEETMTGAENSKIEQQTYYPSKIYTEDEEFNQYYNLNLSGSYSTNETDQYAAYYSPKLRSVTGSEPIAADEEIKSIADVKVLVNLKNARGDEIQGVEIGSMNLTIDHTLPSRKFQSLTLNSAYKLDMGENHKYLYNCNQNSDVTINSFALPDGVFQNGNYIGYSGSRKSGKLTMPIQYSIAGYYGRYAANVPIIIVNHAPKIALQNKSMSVTAKASEGGDFYVPFVTADTTDFTNITNIAVDENPYFEGVYYSGNKYSYVKTGKQYVNQSIMMLRQKRDLDTRGTNLTIRVTYGNLKNSKKNTRVLKLSLKPDKYTIQTDAKKYLLKSTVVVKDDGYMQYDSQTIDIKTTPVNYVNGRMRVTTENESLSENLTIGTPTRTTDGYYAVIIHANEKTKELTAGRLALKLELLDNAGKVLITQKTEVLLDTADYAVSLKNKTLNLKMNQAAVYAKKDNTDLSDLADIVNYSWTSSRGDFIYDKGKFLMISTIYSMRMPVKVKMNGKRFSQEAKCSDNRFVVFYDKGYYLVPAANELINGSLKPNASYPVSLYFTDMAGTVYTVDVTVKTGNVKSVKTAADQKAVTLYSKAPYYEAKIGIKPLNPFYEDIVSVTCDNQNFEVNAGIEYDDYKSGFRYEKDQYCHYYLAYRDHTAAGVDRKPVTVTLTVTYRDGSKGSVKVNVNQK